MKAHSQETTDGFIVHRENDTFLCKEIRGAYLGPNMPLSIPGYYIFVGKGLKKIGDEHPLFFLCEGTSVTRFELFGKIADDAKSLMAQKLYSTKSLEELWDALCGTEYRSFYKKLKTLGIDLGFSPSADPISEGVQMVQRLHQRNLLHIPKRSYLCVFKSLF